MDRWQISVVDVVPGPGCRRGGPAGSLLGLWRPDRARRIIGFPYTRLMSTGFTHLDGDGTVRMVDVTAKEPTERRALARCRVRTGANHPLEVSVLTEAQIAGIQAAKKAGTLVPLCHPLSIDDVVVDLVEHDGTVEITAAVATTARTGVEMEALTACAMAALSVIGACGPLPAVVDLLELLEKSGGRSGTWHREPSVSRGCQRPPSGDSASGAGDEPGPVGSGS